MVVSIHARDLTASGNSSSRWVASMAATTTSMDAYDSFEPLFAVQQHGGEPSLAHLAVTRLILRSQTIMLSIGFVECLAQQSACGGSALPRALREVNPPPTTAKPALELLQHLLRVLVAVLLQSRREEVVCLLAVTFGQVALEVAVFVQSTPLVDELLAVRFLSSRRYDRSVVDSVHEGCAENGRLRSGERQNQRGL